MDLHSDYLEGELDEILKDAVLNGELLEHQLKRMSFSEKIDFLNHNPDYGVSENYYNQLRGRYE